MANKVVEMDVVTFNELLSSLDEEITREMREELYNAYRHEIITMLDYIAECSRPRMALYPFRKIGNQNIAGFTVSDMEIPYTDTFNWHGQNTSQWKYAGVILVQNGRVSLHH